MTSEFYTLFRKISTAKIIFKNPTFFWFFSDFAFEVYILFPSGISVFGCYNM